MEGTRQAHLFTPEGIGIGSTVADLHAAYGDTVSFGTGCGDAVEILVVDDWGIGESHRLRPPAESWSEAIQ